MGWLVLALTLFGFSFIMTMFPKELPRAALRRRIAMEKSKRGLKDDEVDKENNENHASFRDMVVTFKRLLLNATYMFNNIAAVFYYFG